MMKKTLVAVAAFAATAAFAQVAITGRAALGVSTYSATGSAPSPATNDIASRTRLDDYSSRLRFAVNEDLGGGSRAFAVYEIGFAYDTGTGNGQALTANSAAAFNGSRESHLGYGNDFAEIRLGRQNVYWTQGDLSEQGSNFIGKDSFADTYTRLATVRLDNTILVNFNKGVGAFSGSQMYYSFTNSNEAAPAGSASSTQASNPVVYGFKLNYDAGKIHAMADYQLRKSDVATQAAAFNANTSAFDATSWKLGVGYRYAPDSIVALHYFDMKRETLDATTNAGAINPQFSTVSGGFRQTGYGVNVGHSLGNGVTLYGAWAMLGAVQHVAGGVDLNDSTTTVYNLGVRKDLSKRTGIFASYGQVSNGVNATFNPTGGSFTPTSTVGAGADPSFALIGMMHNF